MDYFGARYYASTQGRFTSTDPIGIKKRHLVNPQDLNRYAYVSNNPFKYIDPVGLEKIEVIVRTFIPDKEGRSPRGAVYKGDNRDIGQPGSFRTEQRIVVETDPQKNGGNALVDYKHTVGETQQYGYDVNGQGPYVIDSATASGETLQQHVSRDENGAVNVHVSGNEGNPLEPTGPGITYNFDIKVQSDGLNANATVIVNGYHDGFPGYEVMVVRPETKNTKRTVVHGHNPRNTGHKPMSLFPPSDDIKVKDKKTVIPPK